MIAETFIHGRGPLYRLDPRPKFILLVYLVVLFLIESNPLVQLGMLIIVLSLIGGSLGLTHILTPVKSILPILILTAVLTPPFNTAGNVILKIGSRVILTDFGLRLTAGLILRFSGITAAFYLFFCTTETSAFILALRAFGLPYRAALTVTISLRYIPDMFSTYSRITDAHKLRTAGIECGGRGLRGHKSFRSRLSRLLPVLISVLIHAVKSIPSLAMALDSKGFGRRNTRTSCRKLCSWSNIVLQMVLSLGVLAAATAASLMW